jgi:galactokinase
MKIEERVTEIFRSFHGSGPELIVRAPGRVNLIGEHTDYNDGFVLPMAIDRAIWMALRPRDDGRVRLFSVDFDETVEFDLAGLDHSGMGWAEYVIGTAWALQGAGYRLAGWEGVVAGDVPVGAGLSSSAALELATARAFAAVSDLSWEPAQMALACQQAENEWVGLNCGVMDQMISAAGEAGHALLIDCRTLDSDAVPLPPGVAVVVLDTATRRGLVDSAYNERQSQCEQAAALLGVAMLRDASLDDLEKQYTELPPLPHKRARHVISENARTLAAVAVMRRGADPGSGVALGRLMNESHASLRDDFEVSSEELNVMVALAQGQAGCLGARMTGAGFGGCAVALVRTESVDDFTVMIAREYEAKVGLEPAVYICQATGGAEVFS